MIPVGYLFLPEFSFLIRQLRNDLYFLMIFPENFEFNQYSFPKLNVVLI
jgi:hypothetical protein